jgi:hypothetical protein
VIRDVDVMTDDCLSSTEYTLFSELDGAMRAAWEVFHPHGYALTGDEREEASWRLHQWRRTMMQRPAHVGNDEDDEDEDRWLPVGVAFASFSAWFVSFIEELRVLSRVDEHGGDETVAGHSAVSGLASHASRVSLGSHGTQRAGNGSSNSNSSLMPVVGGVAAATVREGLHSSVAEAVATPDPNPNPGPGPGPDPDPWGSRRAPRTFTRQTRNGHKRGIKTREMTLAEVLAHNRRHGKGAHRATPSSPPHPHEPGPQEVAAADAAALQGMMQDWEVQGFYSSSSDEEVAQRRDRQR